MAKIAQTTYSYVDDLTGKPVDEAELTTYQFSYGGRDYEIDLSDASAEKFNKAIAPFIEKGRRVSATSRRSRSRNSGSVSNAAEVRAWAQSNGIAVPARGRIPQEVRDQFDAVN